MSLHSNGLPNMGPFVRGETDRKVGASLDRDTVAAADGAGVGSDLA
jgi:hypothetical protein